MLSYLEIVQDFVACAICRPMQKFRINSTLSYLDSYNTYKIYLATYGEFSENLIQRLVKNKYFLYLQKVHPEAFLNFDGSSNEIKKLLLSLYLLRLIPNKYELQALKIYNSKRNKAKDNKTGIYYESPLYNFVCTSWKKRTILKTVIKEEKEKKLFINNNNKLLWKKEYIHKKESIYNNKKIYDNINKAHLIMKVKDLMKPKLDDYIYTNGNITTVNQLKFDDEFCNNKHVLGYNKKLSMKIDSFSIKKDYSNNKILEKDMVMTKLSLIEKKTYVCDDGYNIKICNKEDLSKIGISLQEKTNILFIDENNENINNYNNNLYISFTTDQSSSKQLTPSVLSFVNKNNIKYDDSSVNEKYRPLKIYNLKEEISPINCKSGFLEKNYDENVSENIKDLSLFKEFSDHKKLQEKIDCFCNRSDTDQNFLLSSVAAVINKNSIEKQDDKKKSNFNEQVESHFIHDDTHINIF